MKVVLENLSTNALISMFAEICESQDEASLYDDIPKYNKLINRMAVVEDEFKSRGREARLRLIELFRHPNMQVRLQAAIATLAVAPKEARAMIESIAKSSYMPQAGDAGMCLLALDEGIFKPT